MFTDGRPVDHEHMATTRPMTAPAVRVAPPRPHLSTGLAAPSALDRILALHGAGASAHTAAVLNRRGSRTTDGMRWTGRTVARVIASETRDLVVVPVRAADHQPAVRTACRMQDIAELAQAITTGQMEVHYQPVVDLVTGDVASVEALARWRHPSRGLVSPDEFVPLAETCGLITELTELVARTVVEQTAAWAQTGRPLRCAINLSAFSLRDRRAAARLVTLLCPHAQHVTVEITESSLADDQVVAVLRRLADHGVDVAIDDFGTGYSCLATLRELPAATLKIDRSFLRDLDTDHRACAVFEAILQLANALGLDVVAEGIETKAIAEMLRDRGVRKAQGFLYARPMTAADLETWLLARTPRPVVSIVGSSDLGDIVSARIARTHTPAGAANLMPLRYGVDVVRPR
jgi:EAL domain-containing protein (putative c-di-GMP-specific phosphodiesterase class I)